ncbi:hypothetical protein KCTCHS21_35380 [Cohnella abietis]|uniref:Uncharacterized protein n=1 Tax=Cohnella abietis TaxID=2507935 RepID=A0A3T1D7V8_9BACL|nr:hypothetical protein KCTCHS21_35380 [Cohnella abietis]
MSELTNRIVFITDKLTTYLFLRTPVALLRKIYEERRYFIGFKMCGIR